MVIVSGLLCVAPGGLVDGWIAGLVAPPAARRRRRRCRRSRSVNVRSAIALLDVPGAAAARARRPVLQLLRPPPAASRAAARARALHEPVRDHHLAGVLGRPRQLLRPRPRAAAAGGTRAAGRPARHVAALQPCRRDDLPDVAVHDLKYYPSNADIFRERLLRYARTLPHASRRRADFRIPLAWSRSTAASTGFPPPSTASISRTASIDERILAPGFSPRARASGVAGPRRRDAGQLRAGEAELSRCAASPGVFGRSDEAVVASNAGGAAPSRARRRAHRVRPERSRWARGGSASSTSAEAASR